MGAMSTCAGVINDNISSKEIKFKIESPYPYIRENKIKKKNKSQCNSKIYSIIKDEGRKDDCKLFNFEEKKNQINDIQKNKNNKILKMKNEVNKINNINNFSFKGKIKEVSNPEHKQIDRNEDCDIIECEDDCECDKNLCDLIKNVDIANNNKRMNYFHENKNNINKKK